jgi:hypothetical protein
MSKKFLTVVAVAGAFLAAQSLAPAHAGVSNEGNKFGSLFYKSNTVPQGPGTGGNLLGILLGSESKNSWTQMKGQSFEHSEEGKSNQYGLYSYLLKKGTHHEEDEGFNFWGEDEYCPPVECRGDDCDPGGPGDQGLPEPATMMLMGAGLLGIGALRRRR